MAGFESACVSVAAARLDAEPTLGDVEAGCIVEIKSGRAFLAQRGGGLDPAPTLSANTSVGRMFWTYGFRGRPSRAVVEVIGDLLDASSVGGGTFDLGSATYDMTRIVTGQLDAYVEPGPRIVDDVPGMREEFERVGGGAVLNNSPYDVAAAALCLTEAGALVTDAYGKPVDDRPLLGSGPEFQISCIAAANGALHAEILREVEAGIERLAHGVRRPSPPA
jgi:fructose-1,6-bisphosphatase/inositol monophosphatase family enzyme